MGVWARRVSLDHNDLLDLISIKVLKVAADPHSHIHARDRIEVSILETRRRLSI